jgi:hypothetical protein
MAVARGMPGPSGQIQICTGHGPVMVYVDETGAPSGPPVLCPDGALSLIQGLLDLPQVLGVSHLQTALRHTRAEPRQQGVPAPVPQARGPPGRAV